MTKNWKLLGLVLSYLSKTLDTKTEKGKDRHFHRLNVTVSLIFMCCKNAITRIFYRKVLCYHLTVTAQLSNYLTNSTKTLLFNKTLRYNKIKTQRNLTDFKFIRNFDNPNNKKCCNINFRRQSCSWNFVLKMVKILLNVFNL